jgi:hypothetical protein
MCANGCVPAASAFREDDQCAGHIIGHRAVCLCTNSQVLQKGRTLSGREGLTEEISFTGMKNRRGRQRAVSGAKRYQGGGNAAYWGVAGLFWVAGFCAGIDRVWFDRPFCRSGREGTRYGKKRRRRLLRAGGGCMGKRLRRCSHKRVACGYFFTSYSASMTSSGPFLVPPPGVPSAPGVPWGRAPAAPAPPAVSWAL